MKCNKEKILTSLTPKQKRLLEKEDAEIERMIMQGNYALEKFKNGGNETMRGKVKWFNAQKGYGFIVVDDGLEYFAHQTQIRKGGFRTLDAGDVVEFDIRSEERGLAAVDIVPVLTLGMMKDKAAKEHAYIILIKSNIKRNQLAKYLYVNGAEKRTGDFGSMVVYIKSLKEIPKK